MAKTITITLPDPKEDGKWAIRGESWARVYEGDLEVNGERIAGLRPAQMYALGVALIAQAHADGVPDDLDSNWHYGEFRWDE